MIVCQDCVEKNSKFKQEAEVLLFPSWESGIKLLCEGCFDDYAYAEGEFNLDYESLHDLEGVFNAINKKMGYNEKRYLSLLDQYSAFRKQLGIIEEIVDEFTNLYDEEDDKFASAILFRIRGLFEPHSSCQKVNE